jgi:SPP1 gp7 family putative phage head morphogenesis protein
VSKAFEEHWTPNKLAEEISQAHGFTAARALNIARTETANAQGEGKLDYFKAAGIEHKEWSDFDGCPECKANAAQGAIPVGDEFQSGDDHEPAHPSCACTVMPA